MLQPDSWMQSNQINNCRRQPVRADHWKYWTGCLGQHLSSPETDPERKHSGKYKRLPRWKPPWSSSWFAIVSFLRSFITFISGPARLYMRSNLILYYSAFQLTHCASHLLVHFAFLCPSNIFTSHLVVSLATTCSHSTLSLFLPCPGTQNKFSFQGSFHIFLPSL